MLSFGSPKYITVTFLHFSLNNAILRNYFCYNHQATHSGPHLDGMISLWWNHVEKTVKEGHSDIEIDFVGANKEGDQANMRWVHSQTVVLMLICFNFPSTQTLFKAFPWFNFWNLNTCTQVHYWIRRTLRIQFSSSNNFLRANHFENCMTIITIIFKKKMLNWTVVF